MVRRSNKIFLPCLKTEISTCKTVYSVGKVMIYVKKKKNLKCVFTIICPLVSCKTHSSIYKWKSLFSLRNGMLHIRYPHIPHSVSGFDWVNQSRAHLSMVFVRTYPEKGSERLYMQWQCCITWTLSRGINCCCEIGTDVKIFNL